MKNIRFGFPIAALCLTMSLFLAQTSYGSSTIKMNLGQLAERSGRIFAGRCISATESTMPAPGGGKLAYTEYTFAVSQSIKGGVGSTVSVKQFGASKPDYVRGRSFVMAGMPQYKVGEEYVLLLTKESSLGLTAPVGLAQGSFKIFTDRSGQKKVVNGANNAGLFIGIKSEKTAGLSAGDAQLMTQKQGPVQYDSFVSLLQKMAR